MTLSIPWLQRYVDIIAFLIVIHVGFSITIIFHFIPLQDAENSFNDCSFFYAIKGGNTDFTTRRKKFEKENLLGSRMLEARKKYPKKSWR